MPLVPPNCTIDINGELDNKFKGTNLDIDALEVAYRFGTADVRRNHFLVAVPLR